MTNTRKHIFSFTLIAAIILSMIAPVFAATTSTQADALMQEVDTLITLASKAARDGDLELAHQYELQIEALGTEILSAEDVRELEAELSGNSTTDIVPLATDINPPSNNNKVHFYKTTTQNYYNGGQYYDIITIRAVSWDDTSSWLHTSGSITTSAVTTYSVVSDMSKAVMESIISSAPLMTVLDLFSSFSQSTSGYSSMTIGKDDGTCLYAIDMEVRHQWIRPHGNGDYVLRVRESKYSEINYSTSIIATATKTNGSIQTKTISNDYSGRYTPSQYGALNRVCQAYKNDAIAEYSAGSIPFTIGSKTVSIPAMTIPPYMDLL